MNRSVINHPEHYQFPHVAREMADITIHLPHGLGSAMEYIWRAGKKPGAEAVEDLQKAIWWIYREIADIERKEPEEF